jgi:fibronectin-binding autotransporter adhesin
MHPTGAAIAALAKKLVPAVHACVLPPSFPPPFFHPGVSMPRLAVAHLRAIPGCQDASCIGLSSTAHPFAIRAAVGSSLALQAALALALAAALAALSGEAVAANATWDGSSNATWSRKQNWSTNSVPGSGDSVFFGSGFSSGTTISLDGTSTVSSLTMTTTTSFAIVPATAGNTLTLASGSLAKLSTAGGTQTIAANVNLGTNAVWTIDGGGRMVVSGTIDDGIDTFSLTKSGTGTLELSAANTYVGATAVTAGVLAFGANNVLPDATAVTLGAAGTRAILNLGSFTDTVAGLAFSGSGGTLQMAAGQTGTAQLVTTSSLALGANAAIDLTGMGTTAGLYRLVSYTSESGTFGSVTGLASGYRLVYGVTELAAQQQGVLGAIAVGNPVGAIIAGGTASFTYTVANANAGGGASLDFTGTGAGNVAGSSSGTAGAAGTSAGVSGLSFTGTTSGTGQTGTFTVTAPGAYGATTASGTVRVDVYGHALLTLTSSTVTLGNIRAGAAASGTFAAQNASGFRVGLTSGSATAGNVTLTGLANLAAGGTGSIVATLSGSQAAGAVSQNVAYTFGDSGTASGMSGYQAVTGTQAITVTGGVYDYANARYDGVTLAFGMLHQGASVPGRNVAIGNQTVTNPAYQDLLNVSGSSTNPAVTVTGFTGLAASTSGSSTKNLSVSVSTVLAGSLAGTVNLALVSDANGVAGLSNGAATVSGGGAIATTGQVYSGQSVWQSGSGGGWGTLAAGFGANWGGFQGSPGLDAGFAATDTATFAGAVGSGTATVRLDGAVPSLRAVTFDNPVASYVIAAGSGGALVLDGGTAAATIGATGVHAIAANLGLATDATITTLAGSGLTISGIVSGSGRGVVKAGAGRLTLAGSNSYTGTTLVTAGTLVLDGAVAGDVTVAAGGMIGGRGTIEGTLTAAGVVETGNSIGILTAASFNPAAGGGAVFEFTAATPNYTSAAASDNDLLRLTSPTAPFVSILGPTNSVDIFLDVSAVAIGDSFQGGFFTDATGNFLPSIAGADYRFFVKGDGGGHAATRGGVNYYALDASYLPGFTGVAVSTARVPTANFASGAVFNGVVSQFAIVPEPSTGGLVVIGGLGLVLIRGRAARWTRRRLGRAVAATGSARR